MNTILRLSALCMLLSGHVLNVGAQTLVDWTEEPGRLGLGYPVPVPVDTPLPFDGFRSYAGLHARHQDLMMNSDFVDGQIVGFTYLNREIWAYTLGSLTGLTPEGLQKSAIMYVGTLHAREWQSPEAVTGLLELMAETGTDQPWLDYVRDHVNIVVIPVTNVDGFLQTQRYPRSNWMDTDNFGPATVPRDGRMRRKNHRDADEVLHTISDHLHGVDLNRNNPLGFPGPSRTGLPIDLTYRGPFVQSEPEIQALLSAVDLAPGERLRLYADMHSYTQVFFNILTMNSRRNLIQDRLLQMISDHHFDLPGKRRYTSFPTAIHNSMGLTSEYFADTYQIPSLTWEIEPGQGGGSEYGGFRSNTHDGFILPDNQVKRMRENLALSMAVAAYHMAGPPHVMRAKLFDELSGALIWSGAWSKPNEGHRSLMEQHTRDLEPGRRYRLWIAFSKPMRWRENGQLAPFPGRGSTIPSVELRFELAGQELEMDWGSMRWLDEPGPSPFGYHRYPDDALEVVLEVTDSAANRSVIAKESDSSGIANLRIDTVDLTGHRLDANPATVVDFVDGGWDGYESQPGVPSDHGGADLTMSVPIGKDVMDDPVLVQPGHSAMWFNPQRNGEGWVIEVLEDERVVGYWFTYDQAGSPRWLVGLGESHANRIVFDELLVSSGASFGLDYDPDDVEYETVGKATIVFADCDHGWFEYSAFGHLQTIELVRLTQTMALECPQSESEVSDLARQSGSWFDRAYDGQGFTVQWLEDGGVYVVWFSYHPDGTQYWMLGTGTLESGHIHIPELLATRGPRFGDAYDADDLELLEWGSLSMTLDCRDGTAEYHSLLPEFGSGQFELGRLTVLAGLDCD